MTAISRPKVKIYITAAGINPSAVTATDSITGEIKSWKKSGGEDDVESQPVFGGFVDKEKPLSQVEIEMEIIPSLETATSDRWDALIYGTTNNVYTLNSAAANKAIFIGATDTVGNKSWAFNNCNAMSWEIEHDAEDVATGTLKFKFSPTTTGGLSNFMTKATTVTALPAWTTLTSA
jgi:hypothetical protein